MAKTSKNAGKTGRPERTDRPLKAVTELGSSLGGFFGKLGDLVERLGELAEAGESLSHSGELKGLNPTGKLRGVYGFSVKTGLGDQGRQELKIEPFGNIHRQPTGDPVVEETREPLVEVYEEEDHVLVLAEIPGVSKKDVQLELSKNRLTLSARRGETRYRKEVVLPGKLSADKMRWDCTNGILKIRLEF